MNDSAHGSNMLWWGMATSALAANIVAVDVTPDGRFAATAEMGERTVRVWDLSDGTALGMVAGPKDEIVRGIQLASNGALLASGDRRATLYLPDGTPTELDGAAWMDEAGTQVAVAQGSTLRVLSLPGLAEVRAIPLAAPHTDRIIGSADGDLDFVVLATAALDQAPVARVFDLDAGAEVGSFEVFSGDTWRMEISEDGRSIASFARPEPGKKGEVSIRAAATGKVERTLKFEASAQGVAWTGDGRVLIVTIDDVQTWRLDDGSKLPMTTHSSGAVTTTVPGSRASTYPTEPLWTSVAVTRDGSRFVAGASDPGGTTGLFGRQSTTGTAISVFAYEGTMTTLPPAGGLASAFSRPAAAPPPAPVHVPNEASAPVGAGGVLPLTTAGLELTLPADVGEWTVKTFPLMDGMKRATPAAPTMEVVVRSAVAKTCLAELARVLKVEPTQLIVGNPPWLPPEWVQATLPVSRKAPPSTSRYICRETGAHARIGEVRYEAEAQLVADAAIWRAVVGAIPPEPTGP